MLSEFRTVSLARLYKILYSHLWPIRDRSCFVVALSTISALFPARREAGYQLDRAQNGLDPHDWKPMTTVG
jgi:hypothetical protein